MSNRAGSHFYFPGPSRALIQSGQQRPSTGNIFDGSRQRWVFHYFPQRRTLTTPFNPFRPGVPAGPPHTSGYKRLRNHGPRPIKPKNWGTNDLMDATPTTITVPAGQAAYVYPIPDDVPDAVEIPRD